MKKPMANSIPLSVATVKSREAFRIFSSFGKVPKNSSTSEKMDILSSKLPRTF
jgi:hypothetical protein